mmetsp:Transcript_8079/g.8893  ORF Transcript_8079/g.8893 Transcript_8079/m.8893 type:complete len:672 (+) Transcript_8079:107-2122(+)
METIECNSSDPAVSDNCFIRNSSSSHTEEDYENDNDQSYHLLNENKKPKRWRKFRNKNRSIIQALPSFILQKRLITLRSFLLAMSLSITLMVFWLLDSLKDPTLSAMVDGNLHKHQPLAKMTSVAGTLILVILMEVVSHGRKKAKKNESDSMTEEEIQSGGGNWTKMVVGVENLSNDIDDTIREGEEIEQGDRIHISIFRTVGIVYILTFGTISYLIRLHPEFATINENTQQEIESSKEHMAWYILGYLQYIVIESYGSVSVAAFWSFTNSTLTLKAAKTYYGFIIAMAQLGAIGGSSIATLPNMPIPKLLILACVGILLQIGVMHIYGRRFPYAMNTSEDVIFPQDSRDHEAKFQDKLLKARQERQDIVSGDKEIIERKESDEFTNPKTYISGVYMILKYNYLLMILGVSCLYEISLTCLDYEMKLIGLDKFSAPPDVVGDLDEAYNDTESAVAAFTTFMGRYGQLTNVLSFLLSYYAFPYLMDNYGLKHTLRIFPSLLLIITLMTFVALPLNLPVLFVSMSILKALTYSINDPAKEILYMPTSNAVKFKVKFWIDIVGARIAKAIGSSINRYAGTAERIVQYGSLPSVVTAMALWIVCYAAGIKFDQLLENGDIVGIEEDETEVSPSSFYNDVNENNSSFDDDDENDYVSESGWESNVSIELSSPKSHP